MQRITGRAGIVVAALVMLAPGVLAGTEDAPEIEDPPGDTAPTEFAPADLHRAWFTESNFTVLVTLIVGDLTEPVPGARYAVEWHERDSRRAVIVDVTLDQRMSASYGLANGSQGFQWIDVDYRAAAPGVLALQIPREAMVANAGDALANLSASARVPLVRGGGLDAPHWADDAESDALFVLATYYEPVYGSAAGLLVVLAAVGGAALAGARRRS